MWSRKFEKCIKCGRNDLRHIARGLCVRCYQKDIENRHRSHPRIRGIASKKLTKQYLINEYFKKHKSAIDIAKECSCSRNYVYKKMIEYNIPFRSKRSARKIALNQNKIVVERIDDNGQRHPVIYQKIEFNKEFFFTWSREMAYVLGVIFTDGCLSLQKQHGKKTVRRIPILTIAQKKPELLEKVLALMDCNAKIHFSKRRVYNDKVAGELYSFGFVCTPIYPALIKLGLHPKKSLDIEFPVIPTEYVRHFIRGCWDGDGSVYTERKRNYITATFYSGSLKFIERMLTELEKIGLPKRTIHKTKAMQPSYYFKFYGPQCCKLYHYFYDDVSCTQYLERKYVLFKKFCDRQQNSLF